MAITEQEISELKTRAKKIRKDIVDVTGWAGGAVKQVDAQLQALGLDMMPPMEIKYAPDETQLEACVELGREVARRVKAMG